MNCLSRCPNTYLTAIRQWIYLQEYENRLILISDENIHGLDEILGGKIIRTPGHTADSMSLLLNDGTLFCGDAAMNGFPSVNNVTIWAEDTRKPFPHDGLHILYAGAGQENGVKGAAICAFKNSEVKIV